MESSSDPCVELRSVALVQGRDVGTIRKRKSISESSVDVTKDLPYLMDIFYPSVPKNKISGDENSLHLAEYSEFIETKFKEYKEKFSSERATSSSVVPVGEAFDVISMLKDKYLVRPNGEKVSVESLRDKYILVWCTFLPVLWEGSDAATCRALSDMFSELSATRSDCEMVIVAKMRCDWEDQDVFNHFLSGFPTGCLAVQFEDQKQRHFLCDSLGFRCFVNGVFLDPTQRVLQNKVHYLTKLGARADAFPFTYDKVMDAIRKDCELVKSCLTWDESRFLNMGSLLQALLGLPGDYCLQRYRSISSSSIGGKEEIPISELEGSHVGLYLCHTGNLLKQIHKLYKQCKEQNRPFEVVLVYFPGEVGWSFSSFQRFIDRKLNNLETSWWVLPYKNTISRRLWVLCDMLHDDNVIMVGSNSSFLDTHGSDVMTKYGSDAYPFSRDLFLKNMYVRLRSITLQSLLVYNSRDFLYRGETLVPVADLEGKDVFVVLDYKMPCIRMAREVHKKLAELKEKKVELVYVYLCSKYDKKQSHGSRNPLPNVPWLVCPYDADHANLVAKHLFINGMDDFGPIVAFSGKDGKLCTLFVEGLFEAIAASDVSLPLTDQLEPDVYKLLQSYDEDLWTPWWFYRSDESTAASTG